MIIDIPRLPPDGERFSGEESAEILELENEPHVRITGPVVYDLYAQTVSGQLVVKGTVSVPAEVECARCAGFFSTTVADSSFLRAYDLPKHTETVDVTGDIREVILLALPGFPVCGEQCKGLCPHCGKNLNHGPCNCAASKTEARWQDLNKLQL